MSSRSLDPKKHKALQPAHALWKLVDEQAAPYRFEANDRAAAVRWQKKTRAAFRSTLGFTDLPAAPLRARRIERVDKGDYVREKLMLRTSRDTLMPVYLLVPNHAPRPLPVVIAFHGHGYGVKDVVGLWEDGSERVSPDGLHKDFGVTLCQRGFAVAAPEISCFGERQSDFSYLSASQQAPTTCAHTAMLAMHLGGSVAGLRVYDAERLVDYLATRPEIDVARLGAMGLSGGGMHTLFSACVDPRIRACVISGYFSTFRDSIHAMHHCHCNYVHGLHRFGEMYDLIGLVAPRPVLIEAGTHDPIFPIQAVKKSVASARKVYDVFGARDQIQTDYFEGRHRINGQLAYDFLWQHLASHGLTAPST